jgi:hypothetical protein
MKILEYVFRRWTWALAVAIVVAVSDAADLF